MHAILVICRGTAVQLAFVWKMPKPCPFCHRPMWVLDRKHLFYTSENSIALLTLEIWAYVGVHIVTYGFWVAGAVVSPL